MVLIPRPTVMSTMTTTATVGIAAATRGSGDDAEVEGEDPEKGEHGGHAQGGQHDEDYGAHPVAVNSGIVAYCPLPFRDWDTDRPFS